MVIYFSGTGNSRYAAKMIAAKTGDTLVDASQGIRANRPALLESQRPWVFVSPTYGWQIPHIFADYLRKGQFIGSKTAYFVMTCGGDIGGAGHHLATLCKEIGLEYQGVLEVVMPENYVAMFPVPGAQEAVSIIQAAHPTLEKGIDCISQGLPFPARKISLLDRLKSGLVNKLFYAFFIKANPFYSTRGCANCGRCAQVCPTKNIQMVDGLPQWGDQCTHCMACICSCPMKSIEYGKRSQGKPRYRCPEYQESP